MSEYKKGQVWNKPKNKLLLEFEKETGKNSVYRGVITGNFELWIFNKRKKEVKPKEEIKPIEKPIEKPIAPKKKIDIFPAKYLTPNQNLQIAINKLFSYNVNFLNPEAVDSKGKNFNKTIIDTICPSCKSITHCTDCFNFKKLKVTYMRICHECKSMFIFSCKYENEKELKKRYRYFTKYIYTKRIGERKK